MMGQSEYVCVESTEEVYEVRTTAMNGENHLFTGLFGDFLGMKIDSFSECAVWNRETFVAL